MDTNAKTFEPPDRTDTPLPAARQASGRRGSLSDQAGRRDWALDAYDTVSSGGGATWGLVVGREWGSAMRAAQPRLLDGSWTTVWTLSAPEG